MAEPRKTFGPVILLALAASGLAAVAGHRTWLDAEMPGGECSPAVGVDYDSYALDSPLAGALALVMLAAWGVVLVSRGWVRRAVVALAALTSLGYLVVAVSAYWQLKDTAMAAAERDAGVVALGCQAASIWMNNTWWPAALLAGTVATLVALAALRLVPTWPEMGAKYDAPTGDAPADAASEATDNLDMWKALDEGRDPTA